MKKFLIINLILILFFSSILFCKSPFIVYYGNRDVINFLNRFKVKILEPDNYSDVSKIEGLKFAYLSIGEINRSRNYFQMFKNFGILIKKNPFWKDSYYINLQSEKWQNFVINYLIPLFIKKGFNGIFLDTVDSLLLYNSEIYVINFINSIKKRFPFLKIMMNRGFKIINKVNIEAILLESTITFYDFKTKKYYFRKHPLKIELPKNIKIFSLDYWKIDDIENIIKIYKLALKLGYKPYVTDISLRKLPVIIYDEDLKSFYLKNRKLKAHILRLKVNPQSNHQ